MFRRDEKKMFSLEFLGLQFLFYKLPTEMPLFATKILFHKATNKVFLNLNNFFERP